MSRGQVLIGTASWTDRTLAKSGWYPPEAKSAEDKLRHYATQFPLVEVDSTYYFMPSERNSELWAQRTPPGFTFNIKAFSLLTGHPTKVEALPTGMSVPEDTKRVYPDALTDAQRDEVWDRFLSALTPLDDAGRLGAILFQFPPWFGISRDNKHAVIECARRCHPWRIGVELRNPSWFTDDNWPETVDFLEGHDLPFVCVDMPQGIRGSVPPVVKATSDLALVRFHGRNAKDWHSGSVESRYRYIYSDDELAEWVPRIESLAEEAETTHVLMNNHGEHAPRNGADLAQLLRTAGTKLVEPPPPPTPTPPAPAPAPAEDEGRLPL